MTPSKELISDIRCIDESNETQHRFQGLWNLLWFLKTLLNSAPLAEMNSYDHKALTSTVMKCSESSHHSQLPTPPLLRGGYEPPRRTRARTHLWTRDGGAKTPCFGGQLKYLTPPTDPSFLPLGLSSSMPNQIPAQAERRTGDDTTGKLTDQSHRRSAATSVL